MYATLPGAYQEISISEARSSNVELYIRLFTVPYFPVRLSRSNALRYGLPILHECQNYLGSGARTTIPEARSIGTFENQDGLH